MKKENNGMKWCNDPKHEDPNPLPTSEFYRKHDSPDGLMTRCKKCDKKRKQQRDKFSKGRICKVPGCNNPVSDRSKHGFCYDHRYEYRKNEVVSEETRRKMSEKKKKEGKWVGPENPKWVDGKSYTALHNKAYELFGKDKDYCEGEEDVIRKDPMYREYQCKITLEKYLKPDSKKKKDKNKGRFDMHCTSKPKDWTIMKQWNWICVCDECHDILEGIGENHPESKLTRKDVIYILENLLKDKPKGDKELADKFGVTRRVVWLIRTNQAWKHIVPEKREDYSRLYYEKVARKPRAKPTKQLRQNIMRDLEEGILSDST